MFRSKGIDVSFERYIPFADRNRSAFATAVVRKGTEGAGVERIGRLRDRNGCIEHFVQYDFEPLLKVTSC